MPHDGLSSVGRNYAAIAPLTDARRVIDRPRDNPSSSDAFFRELWEGFSRENEVAWHQVIQQAQIISNLRSGKLEMKRDLTNSGYVLFKRNKSRDRSNYPLFAQNSEILTAKWSKARPGVRARSFGDGYKAQLQLNEVDTLVQHYFREIFDSMYETREAYSAQDYGTYITQFGYDDQLNQLTKIVPILKQESKVVVAGYGACYDCPFEGHPDDFEKTGAPTPQCPECKSFRTTPMLPDKMATATSVSDYDVIAQGDIRGWLVDFASCRYDARVLPHESDWFLTSEVAPLRLLRQMFGDDLNIEGYNADEIGLRVLNALSARGGSIEGQGVNDTTGSTERFNEEGVLRNMWLKPALYAGFKLSEPERTVSGVIPAGVDWAELFPKGLCIRGFNDMRLQVGRFGEMANIASGVYLYQSHSGMGKGVADSVDTARDLNEVYSMAMATVKRHGAPGIVVAQNAGITPQNVRNLFKPEGVVFADLTQFGGDINKVVTSIDKPALPAALPQMMIQLSNMLSLAFGTGDFSQGATNNVSIDTLGGQQLAHAKAEEQKAGILSRKAMHREISAQIITDLSRQHMVMPKWYAYDRHGKTKGRMITGADVPRDIKFDSVPDSEIPENKFEKRQAAKEVIESMGGMPNVVLAAQADPKLVAWYLNLFGLTVPDMDEQEIELVCLGRIAKILELAPLLGDPQQVMGELGLQVREEGHQMKAKFLEQILDDDDFQSWDQVSQATILALIEQHYALAVEASYRDSSLQQGAANTLAAQQQQAQATIMAPQIQAQQAQVQKEQQQQAMLGAAHEIGSRVLDDAQQEAQHQRDQESQAQQFQQQQQTEAQNQQHQAGLQHLQHRQQMHLEGVSHEHAMELEKAKAKLKPAPAKPAARGK